MIKKISRKIAFLLSAVVVTGSLYVGRLEVKATETGLSDTEVSGIESDEELRVVEGDPEGPERGELPVELLGDDVEILEQIHLELLKEIRKDRKGENCQLNFLVMMLKF